MPLFPIEVAVIVFSMFVIGIVALSVALRMKLGDGLEPLSRSTRWWARGLALFVVVAMTLIVLGFRHVL